MVKNKKKIKYKITNNTQKDNNWVFSKLLSVHMNQIKKKENKYNQ